MEFGNIGMEPGDHEVSPQGAYEDQTSGQEASQSYSGPYVLDPEAGDMVSMEEFKKRRADRLDTGREQH